MNLKLVSLLAFAALLAPATAAAEPTYVCTPPETWGLVDACAANDDNPRVSYTGAYVYEPATGSFVAVGHAEGSGFFGDFNAYDAFVVVPGQFVGIVLVQNDAERDGHYEYGGMSVGTVNFLVGVGVFAGANWTDMDGDGVPDGDSIEHEAGLMLPVMP